MKRNKLNTLTLIAISCGLLFLLSGCADPNTLTGHIREGATAPAGFWYGAWHGICAPFSFIGMLFGMDIGIYEPYNNGGWYNFGFLLSIGCLVKIKIKVKK